MDNSKILQIRKRLANLIIEYEKQKKFYEEYHREHPTLAYSEKGEDEISINYCLNMTELTIRIDSLSRTNINFIYNK